MISVLPLSVDEAADTFHESDNKRFSRESEGALKTFTA